MILHLHIPKTGGSSLITLLEENYAEGYHRVPNWRQSTLSKWTPIWGDPMDIREKGCISGHFYFGFWKALNQILPSEYEVEDVQFITFVRDPIDRLLSLYHYWRTNGNRYRSRLMRMPFAEFSLSTRLDWKFLDNEHVRRIAGVEGVHGDVGEKDLAQAIENLQHFPLVGLTDRFDETIKRWSELFGWKTVEYEYRLSQPDRLQKEDLPDELIEELRQRNRFDYALLDYVIERDWS